MLTLRKISKLVKPKTSHFKSVTNILNLSFVSTLYVNQPLLRQHKRTNFSSAKLKETYNPVEVLKETKYPITESYVVGAQSPPLQNLTIGQLFDKAVLENGDKLALISHHEGIKWSYKQLDEQVNKLVRGLLKIGLRKGDRLGVYMPNGSAWITLQYATAKLGIILVTLNPAYRASELSQALKLISINYIVTVPKFKFSDYSTILKSIIPELEAEVSSNKEWKCSSFPDLKGVILVDDLVKNEDYNIPKTMKIYKNLLIDKDSELDVLSKEIQSTLDPKDIINIQFTSGTTGTPKGVSLTHHNLVNNGFSIGKNQNFTSKSIVCIPVPLYHCFGLVLGNMACLNHSSAVLYPSPGFDAEKSLESVALYKAEALYGVPTMFIAMLSHPNFKSYDLSSLRTGIMAGSPCPEEIMKKVMSDMGMKEVTICYGMTETSPVSFQSGPDDSAKLRAETVGKILPHVQCKVVDVNDSSRILPTGEKGRLMTKGYLVMKGYWKNPESTSKMIDSEGWLDTGDLATIDKNGYCRIVGRAKDMIIRGGENIYPIEIENFLFQHPKILNVSVVGVPSEKYGEEVCACYILRDSYKDEDLEKVETELRNYCSKDLAYFKVPRYFWKVEEFPTTVTGKIQKHKLRDIASEHFKLLP